MSAGALEESVTREEVTPVERPRQLPGPRFVPGLELVQADSLVRASEARQRFQVNGAGLAVAVLDTGLNTGHVDFRNKILDQRNFTVDNAEKSDDASDGNGHGTNVGGIIVANGDHLGIAPGANVVPLKVLTDAGGGSFQAVAAALRWVLDHQIEYRISTVCMSLGDSGNHRSDTIFPNDAIQQRIRELHARRVAVCVASGNDYFAHGSRQGMSYPGIFREAISVGAVYDENEGSFSYANGAIAFSTARDRIAPFSQRLHESINPDTRTDVFAPGAPITSSGIDGEHGESVQHGTSQATPVTAGIVLLIQEFYARATGDLPQISDLVTWLRRGAAPIHDGDDEDDNVTHTGLAFRRADAMGALAAARRHLDLEVLSHGG